MWARGLAVLAIVGLLATACTPAPTPTKSKSPTPVPARSFTVAVTEEIRTLDPAAVVDAASAVGVYAVYQRLMTAEPGQSALRPDAAADCLFKSTLVYECILKPKLAFHNGDPLTSEDVKFSINRALRLAVPGSSAIQLGALERIETPDPLTVRFALKWPDTQFGFALAAPAAAIVDSRTFDPDVVLPIAQGAVGSGPYDYYRPGPDRVVFTRFAGYFGAHPGQIDEIVVRYLKDSAAVEEAMRGGLVDVVWRGLADAAVTRLQSQIQANPDKQTDSKFTRVTLAGVRVHLLKWSDASPQRLDAGRRNAIAGALQEDRTLNSVIPGGVDGHLAAFPAGGMPTPPPTPLSGAERIKLTLSYAAASVGEKDLANVIRDRLEGAVGVSVQLVPDTPTADLLLLDYRAWTSTPFAWLQPYRESLLPGSASKVIMLEQQARSATDVGTRDILLGEIQKQAAADAVVLPVSQSDDSIFLGPGVSLFGSRFAPGWQLALWGLKKT